MEEQELSAQIRSLEINCNKIIESVKGLSNSVINYKPSINKWSIKEIIAHLADTEIVYGYRLRQIISDKNPTIAPVDQDDWANNLAYTETEMDDGIELYRVNRKANIRILQRITSKDLSKGGFHPELNRVFSLPELIARMVNHDPNHLLQIESLIKRANE